MNGSQMVKRICIPFETSLRGTKQSLWMLDSQDCHIP